VYCFLIVSSQEQWKCYERFSIAHHHASISKHGTIVLLLAHHQVLCYCSLAKPDSRIKSNSVALQEYCHGIVFVAKSVMPGICARSSVSSLRSVCVPQSTVNPRSHNLSTGLGEAEKFGFSFLNFKACIKCMVGVAIKSEQMLVRPWPEQLERLPWPSSMSFP